MTAVSVSKVRSSKESLGRKHRCACGKAFYDLNRVPVVCPACSLEQPAPEPDAQAAAVADVEVDEEASKKEQMLAGLDPAERSDAMNAEDTVGWRPGIERYLR